MDSDHAMANIPKGIDTALISPHSARDRLYDLG